jgi:hypothetical protein
VLKGETDPIERYGVSIKQSDISARLAAEGHSKLTGAALKNAQANAALGLVMDQTKSAQGAFNREADTASGVSQRASAMWENMKAKLGQGLLPIFVTLMTFMKDTVGPVFAKLTADGSPLMNMFAQLGTFVSVQLVPALKDLWSWVAANLLPAWVSISQSMSAIVIPAFKAIWGFVSQYVIPIFKAVLGPAIQGVASIWHSLAEALERNKGKFADIYEKVKPLLEFLRDHVAPFIGGALKVAFEGAGKVIGFLIDKIAWILDKGATVANFIGGLFGHGSPASHAAGRGAASVFGAAPSLAGASLRAASSVLAGSGSGPSAAGQGQGDTYITVTGALDPQAVADQIMDLMERRQRRTGVLVAVGR